VPVALVNLKQFFCFVYLFVDFWKFSFKMKISPNMKPTNNEKK
jgi:hypothetical protein